MIINFPCKEDRLKLTLKNMNVTGITRESSDTGISLSATKEEVVFKGFGDTIEEALEMLISSAKILDDISTTMLLSLLDDYTD